MNTLELKSIAELQDMAFYIPAYQRGYRWTQQQVKDLLKDILEFSGIRTIRHPPIPSETAVRTFPHHPLPGGVARKVS